MPTGSGSPWGRAQRPKELKGFEDQHHPARGASEPDLHQSSGRAVGLVGASGANG
jgi:hypothetical protein